MSTADGPDTATLSGAPGFSRRVAAGALELVGTLGIVFLLPFAIIALALPIVLFVRLAMWVVGVT